MIEDTLDVDLKMFTDIIEDGKKPRSIREIKAKYELNYPFTVKRVIAGTFVPVGHLYTIEGEIVVGLGEASVELKDRTPTLVGTPPIMTCEIQVTHATLNLESWILYS